MIDIKNTQDIELVTFKGGKARLCWDEFNSSRWTYKTQFKTVSATQRQDGSIICIESQQDMPMGTSYKRVWFPFWIIDQWNRWWQFWDKAIIEKALK